MSDQTQTQIPPGAVTVAGNVYMPDAKGQLVPLESIKPTDKLMDEVVRKIFDYAAPLSSEIARFKAHTFDDVDGFVGLVAQEYGAKLGGRKGNTTLTTFDGLKRVQVAIADRIDFGPELQVAKDLVDECLREWSAESRVEIRSIVTRAFNVDQSGKINRAELQSLLRLEIADERWQRAMAAIRDSMRVIGSTRYVRIYERDRPDGEWRPVSLDIAAA